MSDLPVVLLILILILLPADGLRIAAILLLVWRLWTGGFDI